MSFLVISPVLIGIKHMSSAFRKGKTEKTKSALNLFCAFFYVEIQKA